MRARVHLRLLRLELEKIVWFLLPSFGDQDQISYDNFGKILTTYIDGTGLGCDH